MKRPLPFLTLIFCLGIFFAFRIKFNLTLLYFLFIIFFILSLFTLKKSFFDFFLFVLIFCLGIILSKNTQILPTNHISKIISYKDEPYIIKGSVASQPEFKNNLTRFIFNVKELENKAINQSTSGRLLVYLKGKKELAYGQVLILKGRLFRPFIFNRINNRYSTYLSCRGIDFILRVKNDLDILRLGKKEGSLIISFALNLKNKIKRLISYNLSFPALNILEAMLLGERKSIPSFINDLMIKTATVHILVVSGFHVGLVTFIIILFLKMLRFNKWFNICLSIPCLILYCLITGSSNPTLRATVMAVVFLFGYLLKREPDIYNSLSIACLFILIGNPRQLFDIGFQLSFASVISLVYLYPKIKAILHIDNLKIKFLKIILKSLLVSFSAWLGTSGLIAYYFKIFSPVAVLANLLVIPLASLIIFCGFSLIGINFVFPILSPLFAASLEFLVFLLIGINTFLLKLPYAYFRLG